RRLTTRACVTAFRGPTRSRASQPRALGPAGGRLGRRRPARVGHLCDDLGYLATPRSAGWGGPLGLRPRRRRARLRHRVLVGVAGAPRRARRRPRQLRAPARDGTDAPARARARLPARARRRRTDAV